MIRKQREAVVIDTSLSLEEVAKLSGVYDDLQHIGFCDCVTCNDNDCQRCVISQWTEKIAEILCEMEKMFDGESIVREKEDSKQ